MYEYDELLGTSICGDSGNSRSIVIILEKSDTLTLYVDVRVTAVVKVIHEFQKRRYNCDVNLHSYMRDM